MLASSPIIKMQNITSTLPKACTKQKISIYVLVNGTNDFYGGGYAPSSAQAIATKPYVLSQLRSARATRSALLLSLGSVYEQEEGGVSPPSPRPRDAADTIGTDPDPDFAPFFRIAPTNELGRIFGPHRFYPMSTMISQGVRLQKTESSDLILSDFLRQMDRLDKYSVASVHIFGVLTGVGILSNANLAYATLPSVPIYVHHRGCADSTPELHDAALASIKRQRIHIV